MVIRDFFLVNYKVDMDFMFKVLKVFLLFVFKLIKCRFELMVVDYVCRVRICFIYDNELFCNFLIIF